MSSNFKESSSVPILCVNAYVAKIQCLDPIHNERERCRLRKGYGTHLQVATLAASLGVNGVIEINVFLSKSCH